MLQTATVSTAFIGQDRLGFDFANIGMGNEYFVNKYVDTNPAVAEISNFKVVVGLQLYSKGGYWCNLRQKF